MSDTSMAPWDQLADQQAKSISRQPVRWLRASSVQRCGCTQVHWNKDHSLKQEISFTGNTDIVLSLIDPSKDIREQQLPIKLSGHAQFSHYAITPARGLHFGPNTYNSLSKPRCFEVVNLGGFPFKLRVFDMYAKQNAGTVVEKAATEEAAAPKTARAKTSAGEDIATAGHAACRSIPCVACQGHCSTCTTVISFHNQDNIIIHVYCRAATDHSQPQCSCSA